MNKVAFASGTMENNSSDSKDLINEGGHFRYNLFKAWQKFVLEIFNEENTVQLFAKQFLLKPKDIRKLKLSIN